MRDDRERAERAFHERPMYDWDGLNNEESWEPPLLQVAAVVLLIVSVVAVGWQVVKALGWLP